MSIVKTRLICADYLEAPDAQPYELLDGHLVGSQDPKEIKQFFAGILHLKNKRRPLSEMS